MNPEKKLEAFDLLIIFFFYLFVLLLSLSLFGVFKNYFIVFGLVIFAAGLYFFRRYLPSFSIRDFKKGWLIAFFLVMIFIFVGCLFISGSFTGDALNYWLPLSREIVRQSAMPDLMLSAQTFITSRPPFFILLMAATFSFSHFNELFVFWIPIIFSFLTVVLLLKWWRFKKADPGYARFIPLIFLASPFVLNWGWNLFEEPMVLFFFIAFFYYLEKYESEKNGFNLTLFFLSFVLALAAKETGMLLAIPLAIFIFQQGLFKDKKISWLFLAAVPMVFWWLRSYLIYDNPVFPLLNGLFKGRFYLIVKAANFYTWPISSFFERFRLGTLSQFLPLLPFVLVSIYIFIKERRYTYLALILVLFSIGQFWALIPADNIRYYYPIFGLLFFYFFYGLSNIKSRVFLSLIFFVSLFGLLTSPIIFSTSHFISSLEIRLSSLAGLVRFVHTQGFWVALVISLLFYFVFSKKENAKYLILLAIGFYSVQTSFIQLSWLNIWGPILVLLILIVVWAWMARLAEKVLIGLICAIIVVLLLVNTWGLNLAYYAANGYFPYPHSIETGFLPLVGEKIRHLEGTNNSFYVLSDNPRFLNWYFDLKDIDSSAYTFLYLTRLKYRDDFTPEQVHNLLQEIGVKYIVKSTLKPYWDNFFNKIKNQPQLFSPILEQDGLTLWKMN